MPKLVPLDQGTLAVGYLLLYSDGHEMCTTALQEAEYAELLGQGMCAAMPPEAQNAEVPSVAKINEKFRLKMKNENEK